MHPGKMRNVKVRRKNRKNKKTFIVVFRIEHGRYKESTPCNLCSDILKKKGGTVFYSVKDEIKMTRARDLNGTYVTRGNRKERK